MINIRFQSAETPLPRPTGGWKPSAFKASFSSTLNDLERELSHLRARDIIIIADIPREHIRLDGWPRSSARARTPGITITFDCRHGSLRYDCNAYLQWEANLRAFALTLERLRAIDRYGCTKGEQYAGWRALPPGEGAPTGGAFACAEEAARWMLRQAGWEGEDAIPGAVIDDEDYRRDCYREAARACHPDSGGSVALFTRLQEAKRLVEAGVA